MIERPVYHLRFALLVLPLIAMPLGCFGPRIGYFVVRQTESTASPISAEPIRIALMDSVLDKYEFHTKPGMLTHIDHYRKTISDALFLRYRSHFGSVQMTQVPLDEGHEIIVWQANPHTTPDYRIALSLRVEYLIDGKIIGELTTDDLIEGAGLEPQASLENTVSAAIARIHATHQRYLQSAKGKVALKTQFLLRGKIFSVQGKNLVVSGRIDYPARSGQVLSIVDAQGKPAGRLKVGSVFHTNFHAEMISGAGAVRGAEVGVFTN